MTSPTYKIAGALYHISKACPDAPARKIVFEQIRFILSELLRLVEEEIDEHEDEDT